LTSNCWICEGWNEYCFEFVQGVSGLIEDYDPKANPLFIHFEHEGYKARLLTQAVKPNKDDISGQVYEMTERKAQMNKAK